MNTDQSGENSKAKVRLSEFLPNGSQAILAEKHGFTQGYISQVLSGIRNNEIVYMDALDMAEKEKIRREEVRPIEEARQKEIQERLANLSV